MSDLKNTSRIAARAFVLLALCVVVAPVSANDARYILSEDNEALGFPFSDAVRVGDLIFLSGQLGNRPGTAELVPGGIGPETHQTMANIEAALALAGAKLSDVVKCTVMLADIEDWPAFNEVYASYFPGPKPARSAFATNGLALGALVEVECWAALTTDSQEGAQEGDAESRD